LMMEPRSMKSKLLRRSGMKREGRGAGTGLDDSEPCKTDPNGRSKADSLRI